MPHKKTTALAHDQVIRRHRRQVAQGLSGLLPDRLRAVEGAREAIGAAHATGDLAVTIARQSLRAAAEYPVGLLTHLYRDAYGTGGQLAQGFVTVDKVDTTLPTVQDATATSSIDWSEWVPGDTLGVEDLLSGPEAGSILRQLLADQNVTIKSISDYRLNELAQAIADNIGSGEPNSTLAKIIAGILDDPARAELVAATETTRALVAGEFAQYLSMGVQTIAFLSAEDNRVCSLCDENEAQGMIPISQTFVNGNPPTHPDCRCTIVPGS